MGFEIQKKFDYAEVSADLGASLRKHEATIPAFSRKPSMTLARNWRLLAMKCQEPREIM